MLSAQAIKPTGKIFNPQAMQKQIEITLDAAAKGVKADYGVTTQTWNERPEFTIQSAPGSRIISTTDKKYIWTDQGTRPHVIKPKNKPFLQWKYPFKPKTRPRYIGSNKGSVGTKTMRSKWVLHPGTFAREFTQVIHAKWEKQFPILMRRALAAALK